MAYATVEDVQARMKRDMTTDEQAICSTLLDDAAVRIDCTNTTASDDVKKVVSCSMLIRVLGDGSVSDIPIGASQGSRSALGYSESWTMSVGSVGELYLSKSEKRMLGLGDRIGSYSPVEELCE